MFSDQKTQISPSGALLAYHQEDASRPARAILIVCHGLTEHSKRYSAFASAMAPSITHMKLLTAIRCGEVWVPQLARQLATINQIGQSIVFQPAVRHHRVHGGGHFRLDRPDG